MDTTALACGAHGDAVDYVAQAMGLTARDALEQINRDFGLGLARGGRLSPFERAKAAREAQAHRDRRRAVQMALHAAETAYLDALSEWLRLERNRDDYAPKAAGEAWHPLFVEALQQGALWDFGAAVDRGDVGDGGPVCDECALQADGG